MAGEHIKKSVIITLTLASLTYSQQFAPQNPQYRPRDPRRDLEVVEPEEQGILARILGDEAQARIVESVGTWAQDKAKENPGCVERFICESYRTGETMSGIPYLFMSITNAAVSFMLAEQFGEAIQMDAITRAAKYGRTTGTCERMQCPVLDGQLRTVTGWLQGFEEILGYVVNSVSHSFGMS